MGEDLLKIIDSSFCTNEIILVFTFILSSPGGGIPHVNNFKCYTFF